MGMIQALAISIGVLGGVATFLFLGPAGGLGLQIWAAFIAWACFFHCGGKEAGLSKTIIHNIFGSVMAWLALVVTTQLLAGALGVPLAAGIAVGITIVILVLAASNPMLSDIPATVFGYAPVAGLFLLGEQSKHQALLSASLENPLINIVVSMIVGAIFAYVSEKVAGALAKK